MLSSVQQFIAGFGIMGAFCVMVVENLGIPFPTEVGFLIAQGLIVAGEISYVSAILIITTGHVIGAIIAYAIGRWGDEKSKAYFARNNKIHLVKQKLDNWYAKYGSVTVFTTRLIGYVRPWSSLVAGFAGISFWPFLIWTTLGSLIFSIVTLTITKYIVAFWLKHPTLRPTIIIIFFFLFFGIILYEVIRQTYGHFQHRRK